MANWNTDPLKDYYAVLGVLPTAELVVIRAAYRALALRYHPDQWQGQPLVAETRIRELNEAHEFLCNEETRSRYDALRNQSVRNSGEPTANRSRRPHRGRSRARAKASSNIEKSNITALVVGLSCFGLVVMLAVGHGDGDRSTSAIADRGSYLAARYRELPTAPPSFLLKQGPPLANIMQPELRAKYANRQIAWPTSP